MKLVSVNFCLRLFVGVFASVALHVAEAEETNMVQRWTPADFSFPAKAKVENPFMVRFAATVTNPKGKTFVQDGFYDGDGKWKVRVSASEEGNWSLVTQSELPELDGKKVQFACVPNANPKVHGGLRVDEKNPHHFVFEDGSRFYLLGYECDWLWALDAKSPKLETINPFLDKISANGFNYLILAVYSHDTKWREGKTAEDDFGPPPLFPWEGTSEKPDHQRFNLAYWQHFDRMMAALWERGLQTHLLIKVYNKMVTWPTRGTKEDDLYFRWLIARYAAYPNVIWDFAKEAHREKSLEYKLGRLSLIRTNDSYHRLMTVHDDDAANDAGSYDALTDFRADQKHTNFFSTVIKQRQRREWPVANLEFGYECGPGGPDDRTSSRAQWPEEFVGRAWEIAMAGGYTAYYYTYTAWDIIRPQDTPKGYAYFKNLRDFFERTHYWQLKPAPKLSSEGWVLANEGREYVVGLKEAKPFTLRLGGGEWTGEWFNPLTAQRVPAATIKNGLVEFNPPKEWLGKLTALHVRSAK